MKTKRKAYLIVVVFFLGMFFAKWGIANAACESQQEDYMSCMSDYSLSESDCDSFYSAWQSCEYIDNGAGGDNFIRDNQEPTVTDPGQDYENTGYTQEMCNQYYGPGYVPNGYGCDKVESSGSCADTEYRGRDGRCYPKEDLGLESSGGEVGVECYNNDNEACRRQFGEGYKCNDIGKCVTDGFFNATECNSNADCDRLYGSGFECSGVFVSTCERVSVANTSTGNSGSSKSPAPVATTTASTYVNGQQIPAGTQVNSDGSAINPKTGEQVAPAGSFDVPSSISSSSNFVMCANGILAPECRDINGNEIAGGIPLVMNPGYDYSSSGNGGLGSVAGLTGAYTPKCGVGFKDIGGVCFPTNTGLSDAPVYVILSNIFSWIMGLFTTLAVIAFVISGVQYLLSSGDESLAKSAKSNATNAVFGIIIGLSGFIIIQAIAAALSGQGYFF